jgi:hypothetical protein
MVNQIFGVVLVRLFFGTVRELALYMGVVLSSITTVVKVAMLLSHLTDHGLNHYRLWHGSMVIHWQKNYEKYKTL